MEPLIKDTYKTETHSGTVVEMPGTVSTEETSVPEFDEYDVVIPSGNGPKKINIPSVHLQEGEKVRISIKKEKENKGTSIPSEEYDIIKENENESEGNELNISRDYTDIIKLILNLGIGFFVISAPLFLVLSFINVISTVDALFAFFMCALTAGVFSFDKLYRRLLNSGSNQ
jgi:predicted DNA-binding antitoxin AbrB/MazE fold protein